VNHRIILATLAFVVLLIASIAPNTVVTAHHDPAPLSPEAFDASYKTGPDTAYAGDLITYTIVAVNGSTAMAQNVVLSDTLPNEVSFVPGSCTYDDGNYDAWPCQDPADHLWTENLAPGGRITTTLAVEANVVEVATELINHAYLEYDGEQKEMTHTTTLLVSDFEHSYKTAPSVAEAGDLITYTIVAVNSGIEIVQDVVLSDVLPDEVSVVTGSCTYDDGHYDAWPCQAPPGHLWTENLVPGDRITTTLVVETDAIEDSKQLTNRAYLDYSEGLEELSCDTMLLVSDFEDSYKTGPVTAYAGDLITYTIVAVNDGEARDAVVLSDVLPNGVSLVSGGCIYDDGHYDAWPCQAPPGHLWTENMATGDRITTTIVVEADLVEAATELTNHAYLDYWGGRKEMTHTTALLPSDFRHSYKTAPQTAEVGDLLTYTIIAVNDGETKEDVILTDVLPDEVSVVTDTCTYDDGNDVWPCQDPPGCLWTATLTSGNYITTTFVVSVDRNPVDSTAVINHAYLAWNGHRWGLECITTMPRKVYLPLVLRGHSGDGLHRIDEAPDHCPGLTVQVDERYREDFDHDNDNDWWQFAAEAGKTYTIRTFDLADDADTVLYLYGSDCTTELATNDDAQYGDPSSRIVWQAPADGEYHAMVRHFDWQKTGPSTEYTFSVERGVIPLRVTAGTATTMNKKPLVLSVWQLSEER
jgi:large repetitive protein